MLQLANWLYEGGKDYKQGVLLLGKIGMEARRIRYFKTDKPSEMQRKMLRNHLINYARIHKVKPAKFVRVTPSTAGGTFGNKEGGKRINTMKHVNVDKLPDELRAAYNEVGEMGRKRTMLREKLKLLPQDSSTKAERSRLAKEVVAIDKGVHERFRRIDEWVISGVDTSAPSAVLSAAAEFSGGSVGEGTSVQGGVASATLSHQEGVVTSAPLSDQKDGLSDLEKDRRIKANLNYIRRYHKDSTKANKVKERMKELDGWGVEYQWLIDK